MTQTEFFVEMMTDFPRDALEFFAPDVAAGIPRNVTITAMRSEKKVHRMFDGQRILELPLRLEHPDGAKPAERMVIFILL